MAVPALLQPIIALIKLLQGENSSTQENVSKIEQVIQTPEGKELVPLNERLLLRGGSDETKSIIMKEIADIYIKLSERIEPMMDWHHTVGYRRDAEAYYQSALKVNQQNKEALLGEARCKLELGKYKQAIDLLEKNQDILKGIPDYWVIQGNAWYRRLELDYQKAHACGEFARKLDPLSKEAAKLEKIAGKLKEYTLNQQIYNYQEPLLGESVFGTKYEERIHTSPTYNILSIDGGGVRGAIPMLCLAELEHRTRKPIAKLFQTIAGTSIGGIIAAALATPAPIYSGNTRKPYWTAKALLEESMKVKIFVDKKLWAPYWAPYYSSKGREALCNKLFDSNSLKDTLTDIIIPVTYDEIGLVSYYFTSAKARWDPLQDISLFDVGMATSAAPTYFQPHEIKRKERIQKKGKFVDGGIHCNNPAQLAYSEVSYIKEVKKISVLSLGTGKSVGDPILTERQGLWFWARNFPTIALHAQESQVDQAMWERL
ncbi:11116_t:CDS:1, partial [Scutellospora calospora]